jgi:hypothetical protein
LRVANFAALFLGSACVEEPALNDPPPAPPIGACYIVGGAPTGAWVGQADAIASYSSGGWRFAAAIDGMSAYVRSTGVDARYRSGAWEYDAAPAAAIADPGGGSVIDVQARAGIGLILAALREHGLIES